MFLDELIGTFPNEQDFVTFRVLLGDIPIVDVMNYVVVKLCPLRELVRTRNEQFFIGNNVLFGGFSNEQIGKVNHFRNMWLSPNLDKEEKDAMWRWFGMFISLGNKYMEATRTGTTTTTGGVVTAAVVAPIVKK